MGLKLILALIITITFYIRNKVGFRFKILFHPILLTPLLGAFLGAGGFITGVTIGVVVELIWGSNLVDYNAGLKYGLLVSLITVVLVMLTNNISLFFNLLLVVILVFSFQESLDWLEDRKYFYLLVFIFNLLMLASIPLIKYLLGWIPAQFLNYLAVGGGLLPIVGLAILLIQAIYPLFKRDNIWYYSYALATVISSVLVLNNYYFGLILFPIVWYGIYYIWNRVKVLSIKEYLRIALAISVVVTTPLIVTLNSPFITGLIKYILWSEALLALLAIVRILKSTALEGYLIMVLLGIIGCKIGVFI